MGFKGINVRQTSDRLIFDVFLQDSSGALVTSGTPTLKLYELQSDGTLKSYDFADNTFKATALGTETSNMTHRKGNNGGTNTGIYTVGLTTISGFTLGNIYYALCNLSTASPTDQVRKFQFGSGEGDLLVDANGRVEVQSGFSKNVAKSNVTFPMTLSGTDNPASGVTVTVQVSIDAGSFANVTSNSGIATEIASTGIYKINLSAAEMNGDIITLRATASGSNTRTIVIPTTP